MKRLLAIIPCALALACTALPVATSEEDAGFGGGGSRDASVLRPDGGSLVGDAGMTSSGGGSSSSGGGSSSSSGGASSSNGGPCNLWEEGPSDKSRVVLISHPFGEEPGEHGTTIRSLTLTAGGTLQDDGMLLDVGVRVDQLAFLPSGAFALVLDEDGRLQTVRVDSVTNLSLVDAVDLPSAGYGQILVDAAGEQVFIVGSNVDETSGISTVKVACDGSLTVVENAFFNLRLAESLVRIGSSNRFVLLGGQAVFEPQDPDDIRMLEWTGNGFNQVGAYNIFMDFVGTGKIDLSPDGELLVVPNDSIFSTEGNQVLVASVQGDTITEETRLMLEGPSAALFSPDGATLLVTQPERNRVSVFSRSGTMLTPQAGVGGIGLADQMAMVRRGTLSGLVLLPSVDTSGGSNVAILRITGPGVVMDEGQLELGDGIPAIPDAVAVTP